MKILFNGCSWTQGIELLNNEKHRFSKLTSNHFNIEEYNIGYRKSDNTSIVERYIKSLKEDSFDMCVMQCSFFERFKIPINDVGTLVYPNAKLHQPTSIGLGFKVGQYIYRTNKKYETYIYHHFFSIASLYQICKLKNIKLVLFFIDEQSIEPFEKISKNYKYDFDIVKTSLLEVANPNTCKFGPRNHPLEDGHKLLAEKLFIPEIEKRL